MKYDLIFHFGYGKAESDWCKLYTNLNTTEVDNLLNQLRNYGEVPLDKIINVENITLNKTFYIYLDKPREAYLTVCVMESVGLAGHSILDNLNAGLLNYQKHTNLQT